MRGHGKKQTGGWMYNILPYIEEQAIYDLTNDGNPAITAQQKAAAVIMQQTPVAIFNCPSRRTAKAYPYGLPSNWQPVNSDPMQVVAHGDYAANGGDGKEGKKFAILDARRHYHRIRGYLAAAGLCVARQSNSFPISQRKASDGHQFSRAEISIKKILDGTSKVYMVGEKYVRADKYEPSGSDSDDDGGDSASCYQGYDWDVNRWATVAWPAIQDRAGFDAFQGFGSAHAGVWHAAFCDGSVHGIPYDIEVTVHMQLANRFDGNAVAVP